MMWSEAFLLDAVFWNNKEQLNYLLEVSSHEALSHGYLSSSPPTYFFPSSSPSHPVLFPLSFLSLPLFLPLPPTVCWWEWASSETGISESAKLCPLRYFLWRVGRSLSQTLRNNRSKNIHKVVSSTAVCSVKTTLVIASTTYAELNYLVSFPDPALSQAGHETVTFQCGANVSKLS